MCSKLATLTLRIVGIVFLWNTTTSYAQLKADKPKEGLDKDSRLSKMVSLEVTGASVTETLENLEDKSIRLTCDQRCADQKVQIRVRNRTLRSIMAALAEVVDGSWQIEQDGTGYRLEMNSESIVKRDKWWRIYMAAREKVLSKQRDAIVKRMHEPPYHPKVGDANPEQVTESAFAKAALAQNFWNALQPDLQSAIAMNLVQTPLCRRLAFYTGVPLKEGSITVPFANIPETAQNALLQGMRNLGAKDVQPQSVRFLNCGFHVDVRADTKNLRSLSTEMSLSVPMLSDMKVLSLDHDELPDEVQRLGKAAPREWRELADFQKSRVWPNDRTASKLQSLRYRRSEVIRWIAKHSGIDYVADYYSAPGRPMPPDTFGIPPARPLKEELDYRAAEQDMSWKRSEDGTYLFRNNRWYRDDRLEVSNRTLNALKPLYKQYCDVLTSPTFKEEPTAQETDAQLKLMAEISNRLNIWQIANGLSWYVSELEAKGFDPAKPTITWRPYVYLAEIAITNREKSRFYASLNHLQQKRLMSGQLDMAGLSPNQRIDAANLAEGSPAQSQNPVIGLQCSRVTGMQNLGYVSSSLPAMPLELELYLR